MAGDFLPAGKLAIVPQESWRETAEPMAHQLEDVDIGFLNLEATLDADGLAPRRLAGIGEIVSAQSTVLDYVEAAKFRVIGIANNHSYDFGAAGAERTRAAVCGRGLHVLGASRRLDDAPEVFVWRGGGDLRVGFWAAAKAATDFASRRKAGIEPATQRRALWAIQEMNRRGAQFCMALIHAGVMRTNHPDPEDVRLLDTLARCGFDLVAGSHSHRVSGYRALAAPTTRQHPSFCFYGLGSVVSGYAASPEEREGLIVVASLDECGGVVRIEVRPVVLNESGFGEIPWAGGGSRLLDRFQRLSNEITDGSFEPLFYRDVSRGLIRFYLRDAKAAFRQAGVRGLARKAGRVRMRHIRRFVHRVID